MGLKLEKVVPWGRSLAEYKRMFALTNADLNLKILDCAGGPASFNAEMTKLGHRVISCDPVYQFSADEIAQRIQETYQPIIEGVAANLENYVWDEVESPQKLGEIRMAAMRQFLADFPLGLQQQRYLTDSLPALPFTDNEFDLALCSHFLFSYSDHLSKTFHLDAIVEMCRVAKEVRIFPLLNLACDISPWLVLVMSELTTRGYEVKIQQVNYEFQKGGNQMLRINS